MFIAMDNNQKRWNCMEEIPAVTEGPFYCLACHSPVRLKNGSVLRAHFAHVKLQHCPYHHEAESFEHLELKASLYDWASKESHTEVESYLADFQQIADKSEFLYEYQILHIFLVLSQLADFSDKIDLL